VKIKRRWNVPQCGHFTMICKHGKWHTTEHTNRYWLATPQMTTHSACVTNLKVCKRDFLFHHGTSAWTASPWILVLLSCHVGGTYKHQCQVLRHHAKQLLCLPHQQPCCWADQCGWVPRWKCDTWHRTSVTAGCFGPWPPWVCKALRESVQKRWDFCH
jgi:hypothetical protein